MMEPAFAPRGLLPLKERTLRNNFLIGGRLRLMSRMGSNPGRASPLSLKVLLISSGWAGRTRWTCNAIDEVLFWYGRARK